MDRILGSAVTAEQAVREADMDPSHANSSSGAFNTLS